MSSSSRLSFTEHPAAVGETYGQHLQSALGFSLSMIGGGLACMVHAVFPFLFEKTGSTTIRGLHERMIAHRSRVAVSGPAFGPTSGRVQDDVPSSGGLCAKTSS
ncbi:MAG TPA: DUF6356 family protein [Candidatus Acidoferrales bacterium]|jgi:hypothetical protein|nr:DUF6356 family protein [Candidatus Acidoferrales bacterium]